MDEYTHVPGMRPVRALRALLLFCSTPLYLPTYVPVYLYTDYGVLPAAATAAVYTYIIYTCYY